MKELLEMAKRLYPTGTRYMSLIIAETINKMGKEHKLEIRGENISTQDGYYVYRKGLWATILTTINKEFLLPIFN